MLFLQLQTAWWHQSSVRWQLFVQQMPIGLTMHVHQDVAQPMKTSSVVC